MMSDNDVDDEEQRKDMLMIKTQALKQYRHTNCLRNLAPLYKDPRLSSKENLPQNPKP